MEENLVSSAPNVKKRTTKTQSFTISDVAEIMGSLVHRFQEMGLKASIKEFEQEGRIGVMIVLWDTKIIDGTLTPTPPIDGTN